jgi:hypothetical protein
MATSATSMDLLILAVGLDQWSSLLLVLVGPYCQALEIPLGRVGRIGTCGLARPVVRLLLALRPLLAMRCVSMALQLLLLKDSAPFHAALDTAQWVLASVQREYPSTNVVLLVLRYQILTYDFTNQSMGKKPTLPKALNVQGYPAAGLSENYSGLCAFACNYGYCPAGVCGTTKEPLTIPTVSPFLPDACTAGTGSGAFEGLCSFACNYGYCPMRTCTCTGRGPLNQPPAADATILGKAVGGKSDAGLCAFACSRGYCPPGACEQGVNIQELERNFEDGLELSGYDISDFEAYNLTDLATRLVGFEKCTKERDMPAATVYSGWQQSWKLMNLMYKEAKNGIDFSSAAAIEYLGGPSGTTPQRANYKDILQNLATIQPGYRLVPGWFDWRLNVRCDDPALKCPCSDTLIAYTLGSGYSAMPFINFCPRYFQQSKLDNVMKLADKDRNPSSWSDMNNYKSTQGGTWFHELLHIDWVSKFGQYGGNLEVIDVEMMYKVLRRGKLEPKFMLAAEPLGTKMLARYGINPGYWTVQNAESLLNFALARYVHNKVGEYPHLPLAPQPPDRAYNPDFGRPYFTVPGLFQMFGDGTVEMDANTTEYDHLSWDPTGTCAVLDNSKVDNDSQILTLSADFAAETDYPADYMSSWSSWAGLTAPTPTPTPTKPPASTPTPSPFYDCKGDTLCSTTNVKFCDKAVNNMERGSKIYTSGDLLASAGNCWANSQGFGCSVKIRGKDNDGKACKITGDDMWVAYQDIRKTGDCSKCGSKHFGNGCMVSVDYYYGCDNRDSSTDRKIDGLGNGTLESSTLEGGFADVSD